MTHQLPQLHDHAGARWLALILPVMLVVMLSIILVMIYPFVG